jgi:hypothetical protein
MVNRIAKSVQIAPNLEGESAEIRGISARRER